MKRLLLLALFTIAVAAPAVAQQQYPTLQKGVQPEKLYHFGEIDNVNVFNGNLVITIPVGMSYPLNGSLSYQLTLSYNSKAWDFYEFGNVVRSRPSVRSNAGIGWIIGMGRFIPNTEPTNLTSHHVYEGPDGGDHLFNSQGGDRTTDGTNLRLRVDANDSSRRYVDFPDGKIHTFVRNTQGQWVLRNISGPLGSQSVTFSEGTGSPAQCVDTVDSYWKISDSTQRDQYVCFRNRKVDGVDTPMIHKISMVAPHNARAVYSFEYDENVTVYAPPQDTDHSVGWSRTHTVPQLRSMTLPAGGGQYGFVYNGDAVTTMTLPTQAKISYEYDTYTIPALDKCASSYGLGYGFGSSTQGVFKKTVNAAFPSASAAVWTYNSALVRRKTDNLSAYTSVDDCNLSDATNPTFVSMWDEFVVTVTDPVGNKVANHFSVWPGNDHLRTPDEDVSPAGARREHHGYPYGLKHPNLDLYLSQEFFDCATAPCKLMRTRWVRHDNETTAIGDPDDPYPNRLAAERTFYHDEPSGCTVPATATTSECSRWTGSESSDWDSYGHYRVTTQSGNLKNGSLETRTSTTAWNKENGVHKPVLAGDKWILNTHEGVTVTDAASTVRETACFDRQTGFMRGRRQLAGSTPAAGDLITVHSVGPDGNPAGEKYYGGDVTPLPTAAATASSLCSAVDSLSAVSAPYAVEYQWSNGVITRGKYAGALFNSYEGSPDPSGVLTQTKDPATVPMNATYDALGRMKTLTPTGTAWSSFSYGTATATAPASLTIQQFAAGSSGNGEPLTDARYYYDGMGRVIQQRRKIDATRWSVVDDVYDNAGRKASTTIAVESDSGSYGALPGSTKRTSFQYDEQGRVLKTITPDNQSMEATYVGARSMTRTSSYASSPTSSATATATQTFDSFGRLASVVEGPSITTVYGYDVRDRLTSAKIGSQTSRTFTYDGRGLMVSESHPESGTTTYTFDARGKTKTRTTPLGVLTFTYDEAERVREVKEGTARLKEFTYDRANSGSDFSLGKVDTAIRYNAAHAELGGQIVVTEAFTYAAPGGQLSKKKTTLGLLAPPAVTPTTLQIFEDSYTYDPAGPIATTTYPVCSTGCSGLTAPTRTITNTYAYGMLAGVNGYTRGTGTSTRGIDYHVNGLVREVRHANAGGSAGPVYAQTLDNEMPRPGSITVTSPDGGCTLVISSQPQSQTFAAPQTVTLSVTAAGATSYQWYEVVGSNSQLLNGQTQSSLTVPVSTTTAYRVVVGNGSCTVTSDTATITISSCQPPTAVVSGSTTVSSGGSAVISAQLTGTAPWRVVWSDGVIQDPVQSSPAARTVTPPSTLTYSVIEVIDATGCRGNGTGSATITVNQTSCPVITTHPQSQTIVLGQSVTLTAAADSGTQYSWSRVVNGVWHGIGAATGTTLTDQPQVTTTYGFAVYKASCGWVKSNVAVVTVQACSAPGATVTTVSSMNASAQATASVSAVSGASYSWTVANGTIMSGANSATVTFRAGCGSTVTPSVTVTASCGTSSTGSATVAVAPSTATVSGDSTIAQGASAQIQLALSGVGPWSVTWSDGTTASISQSPASRTVTPGVTTTYTITSATNVSGCAVNASGSATVTVKPPAPTAVAATALSATSVNVTWAASGTADHFRVERCAALNCTTFPPDTASPFVDSTALANTAYVYRVYAVRGGTASDPSVSDLATTILFDDDPLSTVAPKTVIRRRHIEQLRTAVNAVRACAGLSAFAFTDPDLTAPAAKRMQKYHVNELRTALDAARAQLALPAVTYTNNPAATGVPIAGAHITQLRGGVK